MVVSIDPGINACGMAHWDNDALIDARLVKSSAKKTDSDSARWLKMAREILVAQADVGIRYDDKVLLVIELPQVYSRTQSKGDPNDLIQLAAVVGAISNSVVDMCGKVVTYKPREWKGQVPKDVMERRIKSKLTDEEFRHIKLPAKSLAHNVWDAIGIGQKYLGLF